MPVQKQQEKGFSLIEIMVALGVVAIALGMGVPMFTTMAANYRMTGAANDLVASLHAARSEAVKRQATVCLCATPDGDGPCVPGADLAAGWTVFVDRNADSAISSDDVVLQRHAALSGPLLTGLTATATDLMFTGSGKLASATPPAVFDIQLCDHRGDLDTGGGVAAGRWIRVGPLGQLQMLRTRAVLQSDINPLGGC